jgi:hypothetical protein
VSNPERPSSNRNPQPGFGANRNRRRHRPHHRQDQGGHQGNTPQQQRSRSENRNRDFQSANRSRRYGGRPLTTNQVLVKYDNLLEQHLITRRKYYEYFNRVDEKQLKRLESNFFQSIEHLRKFENNLEPWQREALEKRKTERYRLDLTYSSNRGIDPTQLQPEIIPEDQIEDPHFKESQKEAFEMYKDDFEESEGSIEDYLKLKGLA